MTKGQRCLDLDLAVRATLHSSICLMYGRGGTYRLDGTRGPLIWSHLDRRPVPPCGDPCAPCEHRRRCIQQVGVGEDGRPVPVGCPTAEGWRAAEVAYRELALDENELPEVGNG